MNGSLPGNPVNVANGPGTNSGNSPKIAPPAKGITSNHRSRLLKREEIPITFTIPSFDVKQDDRTISSTYELKAHTDHFFSDSRRTLFNTFTHALHSALRLRRTPHGL